MLFVTWSVVSIIPGNELENTFVFTITRYNFWLVIIFIVGLAISDYAISKLADNTYYAAYIPPLTVDSMQEASDALNYITEPMITSQPKQQERKIEEERRKSEIEMSVDTRNDNTTDNTKRKSQESHEFQDKL